MAMPNKPPACPRNYQLRVLGGRRELRFVLQDLHTGERLQFASEAALRRFLSARVEPMRLR